VRDDEPRANSVDAASSIRNDLAPEASGDASTHLTVLATDHGDLSQLPPDELTTPTVIRRIPEIGHGGEPRENQERPLHAVTLQRLAEALASWGQPA
jgi:hypothetical protein